jgi:hypothetical protein
MHSFESTTSARQSGRYRSRRAAVVCARENIGVEQLLDGRRAERRVIDEEVSYPAHASVKSVLPLGVDDDEPAPARRERRPRGVLWRSAR